MIDRYVLPEMAQVWSPQNKTQTWLNVELAICWALEQNGSIPKGTTGAIERKASFNLERMAELELETKHDVMAFVKNVQENLGEEGRFFHYGVTSYDVVDTALSLLLKESIYHILNRAKDLRLVIKNKLSSYKYTPQIGRTHGIHAEPITFGFKLAGWFDEMNRNIDRLEEVHLRISVGKISGAVGAYINVDPRIEELVCDELFLTPAKISTQIIARDRHAQLVSTLAILAGSLERFATEIRNLQRTEILEVQEYFATNQKGSSAMPHKRNPWNSETICGLARVVRSNSMAMLESMATWHERDLTNSSVERIILPDTCCLVDWMLWKFTDILEDLQIFPNKMQENLEKMGGLVHSETLMLALIRKGMSRETAYQVVQKNAAQAWAGNNFRELVENDPEINQHLSLEELIYCFEGNHLKHLDQVYERLGL